MAVGKHHLGFRKPQSSASELNSVENKPELHTSGLVAGFHRGGGMVYSDLHVTPAPSGVQGLKQVGPPAPGKLSQRAAAHALRLKPTS